MYYGTLQLENISEREERNVLSHRQIVESSPVPERLIQVHSYSRNPAEERLLVQAADLSEPAETASPTISVFSDENIQTLQTLAASTTRDLNEERLLIQGFSNEDNQTLQTVPASPTRDPGPVSEEHKG